MGSLQTLFLTQFQNALANSSAASCLWLGGQTTGNFGYLTRNPELRRNGKVRQDERFELGDLRTELGGYSLVIEYDSGGVSLSNLLKYWPFLRGELNVPPQHPLLLCHFSDWKSWGSYRDMWQWLLSRMQADSECLLPIYARQFDHGAQDIKLREQAIQDAVNWVIGICCLSPTVPFPCSPDDFPDRVVT